MYLVTPNTPDIQSYCVRGDDMRRSLTTSIRVVAATSIVAAMSVLGPVGRASAVSSAEVPKSMHGAVETQAITVGNGALSLLVDPGTAYAYSTLDRDDYGSGSVNYSMTARGANLNLGVIAYAVLWPAPDCVAHNVTCFTSGEELHHDGSPYTGPTPNVGIHEAKGFPLYAEALYPPPPDGGGADETHVYKCVLTKDGPGASPTFGQQDSLCKQSDSVPMSAWAETVPDEYRSTGFSRAAGFDVGALAVRTSESTSDVRAIGGGKVRSFGSSNVQGISILNGLITIDSVKSTSTIISSVAGVDSDASSADCTFAGLSVLGQAQSFDSGQIANPQLQAALDQVAAQTGYKVEIIPPSQTDLAQVDEGKFVSGCSGLQIKFTDTHTAAPLLPCSPVAPPQPPPPPDGTPIPNVYVPSCAPALGNREELSFGRISVQQAVQDLSFDFGGDQGVGAGEAAVGGGDFASPSGGGAAVAPTGGADFSGGGGSGGGLGGGSVASVGRGSGRASGSGSRSGSGRAGSLDYQTAAARPFNPKSIGEATAAAGVGLLVGSLALVGVVNALASGRRFRFPGL
jgi:hypothetical protein